MKYSVILSVHSTLHIALPDWEEVANEGGHRALSAVLEEQKLLELIYWYGATRLDAQSPNNTIKLSAQNCDVYVTPEAENYDQQAWDRFVKRFERPLALT